MVEYPKIQTVWERDPANKHRTLLDGRWARTEFAWLSELDWQWTEKIDGTNVRVDWEPSRGVVFGGRTERSQMLVPLVEHLRHVFSEHRLEFSYPSTSLCLYGEGYGAHIQKRGSDYIPGGVSFVLFDVRCGDLWLERHNVEDIAHTLGIDPVPVVGSGNLIDAISYARGGFPSRFGTAQAEGLVMRPPADLFNRRGERVICKVKHKDFAPDREKGR